MCGVGWERGEQNRHSFWRVNFVHPFLKICVMCFLCDLGRTIQSTSEDIKYAFNSYGHLPAFYRTKSLIPGDDRQLPVFYAYDSYLLKNEDWDALLNRKTYVALRM